MKRASVVLADDHTILLDGLRIILKNEFELVATAVDGSSFVEKVLLHRPDVAVVDISMPRLNGLDAFRQLQRHKNLATKVIFLTASLDPALASQALQLGASGYVLKHSAGEELVTAIRLALEGNVYITPRLSKEVLEALNRSSSDGRGPTLTPRERQVIKLLAEGRSTKEIGAALSLSPRTVEFHRQNITEKTGLRSIAELSRYAASQGFLEETT